LPDKRRQRRLWADDPVVLPGSAALAARGLMPGYIRLQNQF
jgi:hypothetical protein